MKLSLVLVQLLAAAAVEAQMAVITPHPGALGQPLPSPSVPVKRALSVGPVVLGYTLGSSPAALLPIEGTGGAPIFGAPAALPANTEAVFLPPEQHYALIQLPGQALAVWTLHRGSAVEPGLPRPIPGAVAAPDAVTFSPLGKAAVLYSRETSSIQVIKGLPFTSAVAFSLPVPVLGSDARFGVTDDATLIAAVWGNGALAYSSNGGPWQTFTASANAGVWSFLPHTHDLIISDPADQEILRLANLDAPPFRLSILAQGISADRLAPARSGTQIVAASTTRNKLWRINLNSPGVVTELAAGPQITSLTPLRGGDRFLTASSPFPNIITLGQ